ncbi:Helicase-like transcription factor HLTF/DNA helicase RAD5, DEAD-box superfamily (ISS) [Diplocarpon rosae]|nr:Helicase-like transcription factor HLTF/DNA helicase RAD5, DEAD-box superfamily (ISS) [Diplocarpon rosae]
MPPKGMKKPAGNVLPKTKACLRASQAPVALVSKPIRPIRAAAKGNGSGASIYVYMDVDDEDLEMKDADDKNGAEFVPGGALGAESKKYDEKDMSDTDLSGIVSDADQSDAEVDAPPTKRARTKSATSKAKPALKTRAASKRKAATKVKAITKSDADTNNELNEEVVTELKSSAKATLKLPPRPGRPPNIFSGEVAIFDEAAQLEARMIVYHESEEDDQDEDEDEAVVKPTKGTKKAYDHSPGYRAHLKPLWTIREIFDDLAANLKKSGFEDITNMMDARPLKVGTFCSGTEAPILAMRMLKDSLAQLGLKFNFEQLISAEIHPAKAAFIERNFKCPLIARDIMEFSRQALTDKINQCESEWTVTTAYGGKAKVPGDLDVLIAGFACDDFSLLNSHRKGLDDRGESGDTFYAIRHYVSRFKPKMIILENVISAPWLKAKKKRGTKNSENEPKSILDLMEELGYAVSFVKMDTKEYYLPHTRQRGYMVCILRSSYKAGDLDEKTLNFKKFLEGNFKRPASVPIEAMLLDYDSPLLKLTSKEEDGQKKRASTSWEKCKLGHHDYSQKHGLGNKHPITNWMPNGAKVLPEHWQPTDGLTERVLDTVDLSHARNIKYKGIDDRYQNGNAMTSTVVGTFMFAAFLHFKYIFNFEGRPKQLDPPEPDSQYLGEEYLISSESHPASYEPISVAYLSALAKSTRRLCICEGREKTLFRTLQRCTICNHISCVKCGQNPCHKYELYEAERESPLVFAETIKRCLPFQINLGELFPGVADSDHFRKFNKPTGITDKDWAEVKKFRIRKALESTVAYRLSRRAESWQVFYDCPAAQLVLEVSATGAEWLLYANVSDLPLANTMGKFFKRIPIARMRPTGSDLMLGTWQLFVVSPKIFKANVTSSGHLEESFQSERGLVDFAHTFVYPFVHLDVFAAEGVQPENFESLYQRWFDEDIRGKYIRSAVCGQAWNSLHAKSSTEVKNTQLFLFLHHNTGSGDPTTHYFSVSSDLSRKRYGEEIKAIANLSPDWRQPLIRAREDNAGELRVDDVPVDSHRGSDVKLVDIRVDGYWTDFTKHQLDLSTGQLILYSNVADKISDIQSPCGKKRTVFEASTQLAFNVGSLCRLNRWVPIVRSNQNLIWSTILHALEKKLILTGHCEADNSWVHYDENVSECTSCSPPLPQMVWFLNGKGKPEPTENPEMASIHERAVKNCPVPIEALVRLSDDGRLDFKVGIDPTTLVHQAKAMLVAGGGSRSKTTLANSIRTSYRLITDDGKNATPNRTEFLAWNTSKFLPNPTFIEPLSPFKDFSNAPAILVHQQASALTWMLSQESQPHTFTEVELVEGYYKEIGYRIEGKAEQDVRVAGGILAQAVGFGKTILVLSAIAQHLTRVEGLIEESNAAGISGALPTKATLILVPPHLVDQWDGEVEKFMGKLYGTDQLVVLKNFNKLESLTVSQIQKATIVIVAWNLYSSERYLSALSSFAGVAQPAQNTSIRAKREWYKQALKRVEEHIDELHQNAEFKSNPSYFVPFLKKKYDDNVQATSKNDAYMPSVHLTGRKYVAAQQAKNAAAQTEAMTDDDSTSEHVQFPVSSGDEMTGKKRTRASMERSSNLAAAEEFKCVFNFGTQCPGEDVLESMNCPILEIFKWGRVVVDEHTYAKESELLFLENVKTFNVWILSGTPRLGAFHDVKAMATLIGINLGRDDFASMKVDVFKQKTGDLTKSELFAAFKQTPSLAWQRARWELAQKFLDVFMRQDSVDVSAIKCHKHVLAVNQSASELAMYMELNDHVLAHDFKIMSTRSSGDDKSEQIKDATSGSDDGKVALFLRASSFGVSKADGEAGEVSSSNALLMCEQIAALRYNEYQNKLDHLYHELKKAHILEKKAPCTLYEAWKRRADANHYGDYSMTQTIKNLLAQVKREFTQETWMEYWRKADDTNKLRAHLPVFPEGQTEVTGLTHLTRSAAALRTSASHLNRISEEATSRKRSLRVFLAVRQIQQGKSMECSKCQQQTPVSNLTLLGQCGHVLCDKCGVTSVCSFQKSNHTCNASVAEHQKISCASLGVQTVSDIASQFGSKMDCLVDLITGRKKVDVTFYGDLGMEEDNTIKSGDKILVFVQHEKTEKKVEEALRAANITFACLNKGVASASSTLKNFQDESVRSPRVLVMGTGDESAAGSNLTVARHIIFVQPLYTTGSTARQEYESAMIQAIGRSRRHGQKLSVNVFELITTGTIEVDYQEFRRGCILVRENPESDILTPFTRPTSSNVYGPLSSAIVRAIQFDG